MTEAEKTKMSYKFFKLILSVLAIVVMTPIRVNAQFYDSDSDVRIYVKDDVIDNPGRTVTAFVMNFNGSKGAIIARAGDAVGKISNGINGILNDDSYFEKLIYDKPDIFKYNAEKSSPTRECYTAIRLSPCWNGWEYRELTEDIYFSPDGERVLEISGTNWGGPRKGHTYTRVSKEKLVELILNNKNKESGIWR